MLSAAVTALVLVPSGIGTFLALPMMTEVRRYARTRRRLSRERFGLDIQDAYRPRPRSRTGTMGLLDQTHWIVTDPGTWRDIGWLLLDATIGLSTAITCLALRACVLGIWLSPRLMRGYVVASGRLLAPTRAQLAKVHALQAEQRAPLEIAKPAAAELRRIERDLHDGAQARLVAMGMSLGAVERLMDSDPEKAKRRVAEARTASLAALAELRDLVHGIYPPVLTERGLGDAIRALALQLPLACETSIDLPGRPDASVESAAYFAVSELLTNAAKHSGASLVRIEIRQQNGRLCVQVTDDGCGGADISAGSGLRGIERRLAAFDGVLAVESPWGGPTAVTIELPCALSSPRTSSSSERA
jgi:signal transduction histidine kinase